MKYHRLVLQNHKKIYQRTKTASLKEFDQQEQQQRWIAHSSRMENNYIINLPIFHTTLNERLERKPPPVLKRVVKFNQLKKHIFGGKNLF